MLWLNAIVGRFGMHFSLQPGITHDLATRHVLLSQPLRSCALLSGWLADAL